jgi:hypothetical protein
MQSSTPEWVKTLMIALVTSFFTVCLIEPVKAFIQRRMNRREMRRALYQEMIRNYKALLGQVTLANHDPVMRSDIGERFAMDFKKFSFQLAQQDPVTYYSLGSDELYWTELHYAAMEHVINGEFADEEQHLRCADATTRLFLSSVKDGHFRKKLIFRVSPDFLRKHFRESLAGMEI